MEFNDIISTTGQAKSTRLEKKKGSEKVRTPRLNEQLSTGDEQKSGFVGSLLLCLFIVGFPFASGIEFQLFDISTTTNAKKRNAKS